MLVLTDSFLWEKPEGMLLRMYLCIHHYDVSIHNCSMKFQI
jgi:hypothetical protein